MKWHICHVATKRLLQRDVPNGAPIGPGEIIITSDDDGYSNPSDLLYADALAYVNKDVMALALLVLDEINLIRGSSSATIAGMADRTAAQLRNAFIAKRATL